MNELVVRVSGPKTYTPKWPISCSATIVGHLYKSNIDYARTGYKINCRIIRKMLKRFAVSVPTQLRCWPPGNTKYMSWLRLKSGFCV